MILSRFYDNFTNFVLKCPVITILLALTLTMFIGLGAKNFVFQTDYRIFFSEENPDLTEFENIEKQYGATDSVVFIIHTPKASIYDGRSLKIIQDFTKDAWKLPATKRVDSLSNYQHSFADGDDLIVEDLVYGNPLQFSAQKRQAIETVINQEPLLKERLVSKDKKVTVVNVTVTLNKTDPQEILIIAKAARDLRDKFLKIYPDIEIKLSGNTMLSNAFVEAALHDNQSLLPFMYLFIILTSFFFLRSIASVLGITIVILLSSVIAMGGGGWLGLPLSTISMISPIIVMTLAVADCVHVNVTFKQHLLKGYDKYTSLKKSLHINALPIFLTGMTTAFGFLTLLFNDTPPFGHMGIMVAFGVIGAWLLSISLFPALLMLMPLSFPQKNIFKTQDRILEIFLQKIASITIIHKKIFLFLAIFLTFSGIAITTQVSLNDRFVQYFDNSIPFRNDTDFLNKNLAGLYFIDYSLPAKGKDGVTDPEYLQEMEDFTKWLRVQDEVLNVHSMSDIFKKLNRNMHGDNPKYDTLPKSKELAAQYLLLYEMSLPFGLDLNDRITLDKSASRVTVYIKDMPTQAIRTFKAKTEDYLKNNTPSYMHTLGTSAIVMFSNISERNINGMLWGVFLSMAVIILAIYISLRDFKLSLIAIIPNTIPLFISYGLWTIFVGEINMAFAVVSAVAIGIIEDDTVHFLMEYRHAKIHDNMSTADAIAYAFSTIGSAIIFTTLTLAIGFGVFLFSAFTVNATLGILTCLVILTALICDFLFLPAILLYFYPDNKPLASNI